MRRVFNHYTRVRANMAATMQENELDWTEEQLNEDRTLIAPFFIPSIQSSRPAQQNIAPARILPHPQRLHPGFPLQTRQPFPLFEKSNVLVMYVSMLYTLDVTSRSPYDRGPTGSGMSYPGCTEMFTTYTLLGKTLLAKTLARVLDVPFSVSDATSFTQVRVLSHCVCCESNPSQRQDVRRNGPGRQIHR